MNEFNPKVGGSDISAVDAPRGLKDISVKVEVKNRIQAGKSTYVWGIYHFRDPRILLRTTVLEGKDPGHDNKSHYIVHGLDEEGWYPFVMANNSTRKRCCVVWCAVFGRRRHWEFEIFEKEELCNSSGYLIAGPALLEASSANRTSAYQLESGGEARGGGSEDVSYKSSGNDAPYPEGTDSYHGARYRASGNDETGTQLPR